MSANAEYLGDVGPGIITQSGGTNAVAGQLDVGTGYGSGTYGAYSLSGNSQLSASSEYVGNYASAGTFTQSGGTNVVSSLTISTSGSYLLGGGALQVGGEFFNQGIFAGNGTPVILSAGGILDLTSGTWQKLSTISLSIGANSLLIVPAGFNPSTGFASYTTLGLTHTVGTTLTVPAGEGFGGLGSISDPVNCQGTITAAAGGYINLSGGLTLSGTGTVNLGSGDLTTNDQTSTLSGGTLLGFAHFVGSGGTGLFTQSGGVNNITNGFFLGFNAGDRGTYNLSGSGWLLSGLDEDVGYSGTGSFTQSGGTNSIGNYCGLNLGYNANSSGTYNFSGGLLTAVYETVGGGGPGTFTQSRGTNTIGNYLILSGAAGISSTYTLSGSGLLEAPYEYVGYTGAGSFAQSGGTNATQNLLFCWDSYTSSGSYTLSGGLLILSALAEDYGNTAFNFSGGTLQAGSAFSTFLPMTLGTGSGATFDTAGYAVTLAGSLSGPGSLTKVDSGTLILAASNTYSGTTFVNAGILSLANSAALAGGGSITFGGGTLQYTRQQ